MHQTRGKAQAINALSSQIASQFEIGSNTSPAASSWYNLTMALIKCSECGKEVSEKAANCPHCGNPIAGNKVELVTNQPIKVEPELTSKGWKQWRLISWGGTILGLIILIFGQSEDKMVATITFSIGLALTVCGIIALIIGSIGLGMRIRERDRTF